MRSTRRTSSTTPFLPRRRSRGAIAIASLTLLTLAGAGRLDATLATSPQRSLAITIDDLPFVAGDLSAGTLDAMTDRLLTTLKRHHAPAIGFVNEIKLVEGGGRAAQVRRLNRWLDGGLLLGNHTYSHQSLSTLPVAEYEADVLRGEIVTRPLMAARSLTLTWFRHPFTHTGPTLEIKARFEAFLSAHGYLVAPFTIEHADYVFSRVWSTLRRAGDKPGLDRLRPVYLDHLDTMTGYFEGVSMKVFGREIPQVLLIHANEINAECLDAMLTRLPARGYRFVTLEVAMKDDAFRTEDGFVGTFGPSWLHRWGIARGVPIAMKDEPDPPKWVMDAFSK